MEQKSVKAFSYLFILISASLWGSIGVSVRYISKFGFTTLQIACFRISVTVIVLFVYMLVRERERFRIRYEDVKYFVGTGILGILFNNVSYAISVQNNSLSMAAILLYTSPFIVLILAAIFLYEKITKQKLVALVICFIGCIFVVGISMGENNLTLAGFIAGIGSAFGFSIYNIFTKLVVNKYHTLTITFYTFLLALLGILVICRPWEIPKLIASAPNLIPFSVISAVFTSAVPYLIFPIALKHVESGKASIVSTFEVAASSIIGFFLYGEILSWVNWIGIFMIVISIIILNSQKTSKEI